MSETHRPKGEVAHFRSPDAAVDFPRKESPAAQIRRITNIINISKAAINEARAALTKLDAGESMPFEREVYEESILDYQASIEALEEHVKGLRTHK